jgi:hypothetical protein
MAYTTFSITNRWDLLITLSEEGRTYLQRRSVRDDRWSDTERFLELIDDHLQNGWYVIPLAQIRTTTKSVLLSQDVRYNEQGALVFVGDVYWYPKCELQPYIGTLLRTGSLLFEKGN